MSDLKDGVEIGDRRRKDDCEHTEAHSLQAAELPTEDDNSRQRHNVRIGRVPAPR